MPSASAARPAARSRTALRALLLGGTAFCGVAMLAAAGVARASNILPTQAGINLTTAGSGTLAAKVLSGGAVAPGAVNYTSTGPSATLTLPATSRTLIDWTSFGVGAANTLNFVFTNSANDIVLNRVPVGASIVIDKGGTVTGQFHNATGGNIWFLADGGVFIHGKVTANGVLATNNSFGVAALDLLNDNITVLKTGLAAASGLIDLSGAVTASGAEIDAATGNIILTGDIDAGATGAVKLATAGIARQAGGVISAGTIDIASAGAVDLAGALDASSKTGLGGEITVTGRNVTLAGASLDASGAAGGGAIRIGGDARGGGTLAQASTTQIDAATTIAADATAHGDGGSVVVWSTEKTSFAGQISARGAGGGGRGGAAEVSSHFVLDYTGFTNLTAPAGPSGTLLLDPHDLTISPSGTDSVNTTGTNPLTDTPAKSSSVLLASTLNSQLSGASVIVSTVGSPGGQAGDITVAAPVAWSTANSLTLDAAGSIAINATITGSAAASALSLVSAGTITQGLGGAITVGTLSGSSVGGASLTANNLFDTLAGFINTGSGNVLLTDAKASGLTVSAAVDAGAGNTLTLTTANAGSLTLAADVTASGGTVDLVSAGTLSQTSGIIATVSLTGSSVGGAGLTGVNTFNFLAGFTNTGAGNVSITDTLAVGMKVSAAVDAGSGNALTLTSTGGGPLTLLANVSAAGGTVDLLSAGALSQTAGIITAGTLTGSSAGGASLADANLVDNLGAFTNTGVGNVSITDAKASGLTVTGAVDGGAGNTLTLTTTNAGPLTLSANVSAVGGKVDLVSAGALNQTGGVITTSTLTGSSAAGATLTDANSFDTLAGFINTGAGDLSITDAQAAGLTVSATVGAGAGNNLALSNTAGALTQIAGSLVTGQDLTLSAASSLTLSTAPLVARDYTVKAATFAGQALAVLPGQDFTVTSLGSLSLTTPLVATRNLMVTSTGALDTTGAQLKAVGGTLTLQGASGLTVGATTATLGGTSFATTGGSISLQGPVNAAGQTVALTSAGTIDQTASGIITAFTVTGSSVGGATLTQANQFANIGAFTNTGVGNLSIADANATGLTVTGAVDAGAGNTLTLTTTTNGAPLTLAANLTAAGGTVDLVAAGALTQTGGVITSSTLTGSTGAAAILTDANLFDTLAGFTNTGAGGVFITDAQATGLTVTGAVATGGVILTLTTTSGPLILAADLTEAGGTVDLVSAGALNQTAGIITTAALTGSSAGGASLTDA
ncbi:MAG: hypothetical protein JWO83_2403, partial [Caulobacteraceae bacterium]|nr:hypothetical protein [Caulobacteraceae bacterium]